MKIMKKLSLLFLFLSSYMFSQVGINTSTIDPSAILQINSTNKGLILPQVALQSSTDVTTIPNPARGLIVFNTKESNLLNNNVYKDLLYTFDGNKWQTLMSDINGILTVNLPKIISRGRRTIVRNGCANSNTFSLDSRDSNMLIDGTITAPKKGYYKYYMSTKVRMKTLGYNPVLAYVDSGGSNSLSFTFRNVNGYVIAPGATVLTDYEISYSGVTFMEANDNSGNFAFALGGSFVCGSNNEKILSQEVIWEYLGESL